MNKIVTMVAVGTIAVASVGWFGWRSLAAPNGADTVAMAVVTRRDLSAAVVATGAIRPQVGAEVKVGSRVSGVLRSLHFNIGDQVRAGDLIAELDDRDLRARVAQAEADVRAAGAKLALVRRGARPEEIAQVQMAVRDAEANHVLAQTQLGRQARLLDGGLIPQDTLDVARKNLESADARLRSSREQLGQVESKFLPEDVIVAEAQLAQAEGAVEVARTQLSYTRLTAPIDGVIASVSTQEGEAISAGLAAPTFVTLVDLNRLQVDAFVDETDIGKVAPGQPAILTVDAFPDREFKGQVTAILPKATVQQNVVYYDTVITLEPTGGLLRPDMTANVTILVGQRAKVLTVPNAAVKREDGKRVVYVAGPAAVERRVIRTGWRDAGFTEVLDGLRDGDRVLTGTPPQ